MDEDDMAQLAVTLKNLSISSSVGGKIIEFWLVSILRVTVDVCAALNGVKSRLAGVRTLDDSN
jgi:hypothetical protein